MRFKHYGVDALLWGASQGNVSAGERVRGILLAGKSHLIVVEDNSK